MPRFCRGFARTDWQAWLPIICRCLLTPDPWAEGVLLEVLVIGPKELLWLSRVRITAQGSWSLAVHLLEGPIRPSIKHRGTDSVCNNIFSLYIFITDRLVFLQRAHNVL
jgi:hypothetical protein